MGRFLSSILDNDSVFGQIMTRCWIIIGANLMFLLFSFPVVTMGPALVGLYHVMLKVLRGDNTLNPIKEFWIGFKNNFKQAEIYWLIVMGLTIFGVMDIRICAQVGGFLTYFKYAIYAIGILLVIITAYLMPVMAAFADTTMHLIRNAIFFACKNPVKLIIILFFDVFPLYLTYSDVQMQPLYAFLWFVFGFGAQAMIVSSLLVKDFAKYLPKVDEYGTVIEEEEKGTENGSGGKKSEQEILSEMQRLGM